MSTKLGTAFIEVKGDFSQFDRDVDRATGKGSGKFAAFGKAAGAGIAVAGVAVGAFAVKAIGAATDVNESLSKNQVLFGKYAKGVEAFSNTSARSYGISKRAALEYTGVFGNLFRALGESEKASAKQSVSLTKLAADMASFNNTSVEDALEAIRSGLVGESEPLRRFGVNMNDATLKAKALEMGLIKNTKGALDPHTKALAASALITSQTAKAHGDFERTSGGLANQQRILKARLDDASASLGARLLPFAVKGAQLLNDLFDSADKGTGIFGWLKDAVRAVGDAFSGAGGKAGTLTQIIGTVTSVAGGLSDVARVLWARFGGIITDELLNKFRMFQGVIEGALQVLRGLVEFIAGVFTGDWDRAWQGVKTVFDGVWQAFTTIVTSTWETVKNVTRAAVTALVAVIKEFAQPFIDAGKWVVGKLIDGIKSYVSLWTGVAGWLKNRFVEGVEAVKDGFTGAGRWITNRLGDGIRTVTDVFGGVGGWLKNRVTDFIQAEITGFKTIGSWIINRIADGIRVVTDLLSGVGGWLKNRLVDAFDAVKDGFEDIGGRIVGWIITGLKSGANKLVDFLNVLIGLVNKIPGVDIGKITKLAAGGVLQPSGQIDVAAYAAGGVHAGTRLTAPIVLMGEDAPAHPEYVIPTNPAYRRRALGLYNRLGSELGVTAFREGGINGDDGPIASASGITGIFKKVGGALLSIVKDLVGPLPDPADFLPKWMLGLGNYVVSKAAGFIKSKAGSLLGIGDVSGLDGGKLERVAAMVDRMNKIDAKGWPYVYGGGHGSFNGPYDCSGLVSAVLNAGGFLGSPVTTDGLKVFGEGGDGKVITIGVRGSTGRSAHTMMRIGNKYLESGSGHGAKWVNGWSGNFPIHRHPEGFAAGGVLARTIADQVAGKLLDPNVVGWGLARGGVVGGPFVGSYATGGVVPRDGLAYVHQGETITPADQAPEVRVFIGDRELTDIVRVEVDEHDRRALGTYRAGALA